MEKEQEVFDELFNDISDSNSDTETPLKAPLKTGSDGEKEVNEEVQEDSEEEYSASDANESRPRNRPKVIPTGSHSDDKIMEARRDFDEALAKMKPTRRRTGPTADSQDVDLDDLAVHFTNKMLAAVRADDEAVTQERPALAKLKMLSEVEDMLTKKHLQEILLDNQVLDCIKKWLEPNIRGHLAVASLRKRLLELLQLLPIETSHLRESGLGRIVMFYYVREGESLEIKKLAGELIAQWSRPILGASLDYREMATRQETSSKAEKVETQLQSQGFKKLMKSGALDRDGPKTNGQQARFNRLLNNRQKGRK